MTIGNENSRIKGPGIIIGPQPITGKATPAPGSGIQLIWGPAEYDSNPQVKSIQGVYRWSMVEAVKGVYDWRQMHADLKRSYDTKKPIMLQLNCPAPGWISQYVAVLGNSRGGNGYQYWDPEYIAFHKAVLKSFAAEIAKSDYQNMIIGIRVQPNAYNTEYFIFEPTEFDGKIPVENDRKTWQSVPADGAYIYNRTDIAPGTTDNFGVWYMKQVQAWYIELFQSIGVKTAFRTLLNEKHISQPAYIDSIFATPGAMCLDTRCGMNPADGMRSRYALLRKRCREGNILGYWEDSQYAWEGHTWEQNIYWRNLIRLDAGISFVAVYAAHIQYNQSFDFVNKYAGWFKYPVLSPGAWIAFHETAVTGNLGFFITQTNIADTVAVKDISTDYRMAFARQIKAGKTIELTIDGAFFEQIKNKPVELKITWYGNGSKARYGNIEFGDSSNKVVTTAIVKTVLNSNKLSIRAISGSPIIHMIEIVK